MNAGTGLKPDSWHGWHYMPPADAQIGIIESTKPSGERVYICREDECVRDVARAFGVEYAAVLQLNRPHYSGLQANTRFIGGNRLKLPPPEPVCEISDSIESSGSAVVQ